MYHKAVRGIFFLHIEYLVINTTYYEAQLSACEVECFKAVLKISTFYILNYMSDR